MVFWKLTRSSRSISLMVSRGWMCEGLRRLASPTPSCCSVTWSRALAWECSSRNRAWCLRSDPVPAAAPGNWAQEDRQQRHFPLHKCVSMTKSTHITIPLESSPTGRCPWNNSVGSFWVSISESTSVCFKSSVPPPVSFFVCLLSFLLTFLFFLFTWALERSRESIGAWSVGRLCQMDWNSAPCLKF